MDSKPSANKLHEAASHFRVSGVGLGATSLINAIEKPKIADPKVNMA